MNNFDFYSPTYFVFGRDRENDAGKYVRKFGGMGLYREKDLLKESALNHLGKEPFEWDEKEFARA